MNRMSVDGIDMDGDAVAAIIRQTREHGKAERVRFTITTPAGNRVILSFQPTYDETAHAITFDNPFVIGGADKRQRKLWAEFPKFTLELDAAAVRTID